MSQLKFSSTTTGEEVVQAFTDYVKDRIFVITGPSSGSIGGEAAKALAGGAPRNIFLVSRSQSSVQPVIDYINKRHPLVTVTFVQCDLASQMSVRNAAAKINRLVYHIDVIINNAATPPCAYSLTEDDIERQFAVNHVSHFLFTNLLVSKLLGAKPGARVVNVSSSVYRHVLPLDDYNFSNGATYNERQGYIQSKAANVLFTKSLAQKLKPHDMQAFALHPGGIEGGLQDKVPMEAALKKSQEEHAKEGKEHVRAARKTIQQGCSTTLMAALDPSIAQQSGSYLEDCRISEKVPPALVLDMANAQRLWELSQELVHEDFTWV